MIDRQKLLLLMDDKLSHHAIPLQEIQELADEIVRLGDSCSRNIPRGVYRNSLGGEIQVQGRVGKYSGVKIGRLGTLGGDISYAEAYDDLLGTTDQYLVTEDSLRNCGYELVEPEDGSS